ncbi:hemolysin family protein [Hyphococcus flavus]|uniref:Hemolysin family protein n=1 Tax=Hyphococcus flavus TaxID=1866326 RepID=A0AAE9ZEQ4_9PROT|nr:hemolysin family protein [Hyphococcus flavus]WDI31292.1 hemolysin family protein [Hyphococcus flavus]
MTLLIFYLLLAILVSFFCSISEAVILSVRPSYVATLERKGARGAKSLKRLRGNLDRPLAAILTANTIAHTVGAAGVGAQSAIVFGSAYVGVTSAVLTLLILVFSEIIPKTLGATHWRGLAPVMAPMIELLTNMLLPFVWLSERLTRLMSRSGKKVFTFSRDEIEAMAEIGEKEGLLQAKEQKIVSNLMRLQRLSARDIMTPRAVIFSAPASMTVQTYFSDHATKQFSRIPIYGSNTDDVTGFVLRADLLMAQAKDEFDRPLSDFRRDCLALLDNFSASDVFDKLMHEKSHIAILVDEYGTLQGLVTLEDVVETLIGLEITDEFDKVEDMQALARKRWRQRMEALGIDPDSMEAN